MMGALALADVAGRVDTVPVATGTVWQPPQLATLLNTKIRAELERGGPGVQRATAAGGRWLLGRRAGTDGRPGPLEGPPGVLPALGSLVVKTDRPTLPVAESCPGPKPLRKARFFFCQQIGSPA